MQCPVCKTAMVIIEHHSIELDYCVTCKGVWFDSGEVELLLETAGAGEVEAVLEDMLKHPGAETHEKKRACPLCRKKMTKVPVTRDNKVIIDVCPASDGIWLDHREIDHLVNAMAENQPGGKDKVKPVLEFLGDLFQY